MLGTEASGRKCTARHLRLDAVPSEVKSLPGAAGREPWFAMPPVRARLAFPFLHRAGASALDPDPDKTMEQAWRLNTEPGCVCCVGGFIKVDFRDSNSPDIYKLNTDFSNFDYTLCCVNSNVYRSDSTMDYYAVPNEMIKVANFFKKDVLRDVSYDEFMKNYRMVRARVGDRPALRALHFFKEEDRVLKQSEALEKGDFDTFLRLVRESGDSTFKALQNIYQQESTRHQNIGTAIVLSENFLGEDGVVKVNGGGFSGTMLAFVKTSVINDYAAYMDSIFGKGSCYIIHAREQGAIRLL